MGGVIHKILETAQSPFSLTLSVDLDSGLSKKIFFNLNHLFQPLNKLG